MILSDRILGLIDAMETQRLQEEKEWNLSVARMAQAAAVIVDSAIREQGIIPEHVDYALCSDGSIDLEFHFADLELDINIDNAGDDLIQTVSQKNDTKYYQDTYKPEQVYNKIIEFLRALNDGNSN